MMVATRGVTYDVDGLGMTAHLAHPDGQGPWPAVLITMHRTQTWDLPDGVWQNCEPEENARICWRLARENPRPNRATRSADSRLRNSSPYPAFRFPPCSFSTTCRPTCP
jgi:hypothetical protein